MTPLRISKLTICDFRGFPGPAPVSINFAGKNLLVYGENGSGKSTIFHALDNYFSLSERNAEARAKCLSGKKNLFKKSTCDCYVEVEFDKGSTIRWDANYHPVDILAADNTSITVDNTMITADGINKPVADAALRKSALDYRALLETNFRHQNNKINLFDVTVNVLLRDFAATSGGESSSILKLWQEAHSKLDSGSMITKRHRSVWGNYTKGISSKLTDMNTAIRNGLDELMKSPKGSSKNLVNEMLGELGWEHIELEKLELADGASFNMASKAAEREIKPGKVIPALKFHGVEFPTPQNTLNEARLSALALAIYLAGRKLCTQGTPADALKLMILDDVLIGLDQSNRLPVLRLLEKHFSDWQIVLLTHDKVWFEMARMSLASTDNWQAIEIFEQTTPEGYPVPYIRPLDNFDAFTQNLVQAEAFLEDHYNSAAAVHTRMALEQVLKKVCDKKAIPIRYKINERHISSDDFLTAFKNWLKGKPKEADMNVSIKAVEAARKVVLNPFSHSTPVTLTKSEIQSAIDAIRNFQQALIDHVYK